jgi:hypothetical protein
MEEFDPFDLSGLTFQGVPLGDGGPYFLSREQWEALGMDVEDLSELGLPDSRETRVHQADDGGRGW